VCIQRVAQRMVGAGGGGRIVAVTSVHEHQPYPGPTEPRKGLPHFGQIRAGSSADRGDSSVRAARTTSPISRRFHPCTTASLRSTGRSSSCDDGSIRHQRAIADSR
jgi:hypothetical protein